MAYDQIEAFMSAIRRVETGSFDGDYGAIGTYTGPAGRALGAYQIMEGNWAAWSAEAGMEGATWRDPYAQDAVARYKMGQYYNQFGSWELAGIAWFAGPGTAAAAAREGYAAVAEINDTLGTTVGDYVRRLDEYMGDWTGKKRNGASWWDEQRTGQGPVPAPTAGDLLAQYQNPSGLGTMTPGTTIRDSLLNILDRFSNAVAGGQRDPSGLASPFTVYGSALENGEPFYFPSELFDSQTVASMTQAPGGTQQLGMGGVPVMGAPPMGASLSMFPVPGYEGALQNDWMEPREYRGGYHEGTDIVAPQGTPIVAPANGTIASIHTSENGGNVVWLVDSEGRTHKFMHLLATSSGIGTGTQVQAGQVIAFVGDTGASSTPHLHYELHVGGAAVDPHEYLLGVSAGSDVGGGATTTLGTGGGTAPTPSPSPSSASNVEGALEDLENKVRSTGPVIE